MSRITIDPITRIEGHLRIEAQIDNGTVTDAWSAGTMFRGLELVLRNRDPREAWLLAQRICGVCTTVHAICSVRAVENALGIAIPDNARLLRNVIEAAQFVHDHVIHFYHLHGMDWVDVVSAASADPAAASQLQKSLSDWPNNSTEYFSSVRDRLKNTLSSGQLGPFADGYWGHPAYKMPPAANLVLAAHYLEALSFQREFIKVHAILGGRNPHPQTYAVGGMTIPLDKTSSDAINPAKIATLKALARQGLDFVAKVYVPDVLLVARYYKDWISLGSGVGNFLAYGDFPTDASGDVGALWLPRGVIVNKNIASKPAALDQRQIAESVAHSWYSYGGGDDAVLHPSAGQTTPSYSGPKPPFEKLDTSGKYSFLKSPRYANQPMEVGPLARMLVAYASGHVRAKQLIDQVLTTLGTGPSALISTLGRIAARAVETQLIAEQLPSWLDALLANINRGEVSICNIAKWNPSTWPATASGWGSTEAPRGALGHWVSFSDGKITNYQAVVPTTWNGSPRDAAGVRGPFEQALLGTPVADVNRPLEILRTIHSFDPCMACAVHVVDAQNRPLVEISNSVMRPEAV